MTQPFTLYKLIVLYMLNRVDYPLTNSQISEFILEKEYTDYFSLQKTLSEMQESRLLEVEHTNNTTYYRISGTGRSTLGYFLNGISASIREEVDLFLEENSFQLRQEVSARADYCKQDVGQYAVRMELWEHGVRIFDMTLLVPTEQAAQAMCTQWTARNQDIYAQLMDALL